MWGDRGHEARGIMSASAVNPDRRTSAAHSWTHMLPMTPSRLTDGRGRIEVKGEVHLGGSKATLEGRPAGTPSLTSTCSTGRAKREGEIGRTLDGRRRSTHAPSSSHADVARGHGDAPSSRPRHGHVSAPLGSGFERSDAGRQRWRSARRAGADQRDGGRASEEESAAGSLALSGGGAGHACRAPLVRRSVLRRGIRDEMRRVKREGPRRSSKAKESESRKKSQGRVRRQTQGRTSRRLKRGRMGTAARP